MQSDHDFAEQLQIALPISNESFFEPLSPSIAIDVCSAFNLLFESVPDFGPICALSMESEQLQQLRCYNVPGDGHCLFSSFSYLLSGHINNNHRLRELICNHMRQQSDTISVMFLRGFPSVESYIVGSGMEGQGYGTDVEISSFCDLFLCNVNVASTVGWMKFVPRNLSLRKN